MKLFIIAVLSLSAVAVVARATAPPQDQLQAGRDEHIASLRKQIAGQESKPAKEVFKNIQHFKELPAGNLLMVMNAFSRALGVGCNHCHTLDQWDKEDLPQKQIAREMLKLVTMNAEALRNIKNLKSQEPRVTCSTCHRGQVKPDTNLPAQK